MLRFAKDNSHVQLVLPDQTFNDLNIKLSDLPEDEHESNRYLRVVYKSETGNRSVIFNIEEDSNHQTRVHKLRNIDWISYQLFSVIKDKISNYSSMVYKNQRW